MTEVHVFLGVFNFGGDPQVVTDLLGISPTKAWALGTPLPGKAGERGGIWTSGRWELASPAGRKATVEDQLLALLPILETRAEAIAQAERTFGAELMVAAYFREMNPGFHLDVGLLHRISALGLEMDFDLYYLGVDDVEGNAGNTAA